MSFCTRFVRSATLALGFALPAQALAQDTITQTAINDGNFTVLVTALQLTGLDEPLDQPGTYTVFAPTDDAFAMLPPGLLNDLLADLEALENVLLYHALGETLYASDVVLRSTLDTLQGQRSDVSVDANGDVFIDAAKVTITDIVCSNGVIHVLDAVLVSNLDSIAETAAKSGSFNTLLAAAGLFPGLVRALVGEETVTVFAPDDAAFAKLPPQRLAALLEDNPKNRAQLKKILSTHVVAGRLFADELVGMTEVQTLSGIKLPVTVVNGEVFVGGAKITATDIETENGNIHLVEDVIFP